MSNIYEMSKKIEEEDKKFQRQAKNIVNAYRKVEQLKVVPVVEKQQTKKPKNPSAYAIKVKETLKQINANKAKQMQSIAKYINERPPPITNHPIPKLHKAASTKLFNTLELYNHRICQFSYQALKAYYLQQQSKQVAFIAKFKLFKLFRAWKNDFVEEKVKKDKEERQQRSIDVKSEQLAKQFRCFLLLKKSFKIWQVETKREVKRRQYQRQIIKEQIKPQKKQQKASKKTKIEENSQLQNKVRGFLDGLKQKMMQKDRLKTIKEKTQQSKANEISQNVEQNEIIQSNDNPTSNILQLAQISEEIVIQPPVAQPEKKAMTNDQLQKMRKQLQSKHKNRKQTLQKLKKQKQQKRRQEQKQRIQIEKQIEIEQKRIKQEKYKQFLRNKQEQEEWERKQKQLTILADSFNANRLKKFYGFLPWASLNSHTKQKVAVLHQTLLLIVFRIKGKTFIQNIAAISKQKLDDQMKLMDKLCQRNILKNGFKAFKCNVAYEKEQMQVYEIMHGVNTLKIFLAGWKRARNVLASQNYDWEMPRLKRAEVFYQIQLKHKVMRSLKLNKQEQKRERCILEQKNKIKGKIKSMLEDNESFDYQAYL